MYPNKPTNYVMKWMRAKRVAAIAIVALVISMMMNFGFSKNLKETDASFEKYRDSAWAAYEKVDSLKQELDAIKGEEWYVSNMCNE